VFLATQIARMLPPSRSQSADDGPVPIVSSARKRPGRRVYRRAGSTEEHDAAGSGEDPNRPCSAAAGHEHGAPGNPAITLV
jgi:hypothetical protein